MLALRVDDGEGDLALAELLADYTHSVALPASACADDARPARRHDVGVDFEWHPAFSPQIEDRLVHVSAFGTVGFHRPPEGYLSDLMIHRPLWRIPRPPRPLNTPEFFESPATCLSPPIT